ncbi:MAG: YbaB/EbfC family nucleoid-associated protein, partial [Desulfofundulus sp.]
TVNGLQQVLEVSFGPGALALDRGELAAVVRDTFNEALAEARRQLKEEVMKMTGINLPHLPGLF